MNVSTLIFLGLAVVWAIVLLPDLIKKVSGSRHSDSIRSFNHQLSVLHRSEDRTAGRSNVIDLGSRAARRDGGSPMTRMGSGAEARRVPPSVRKRRQEVLTALASAAILTLLCTVAFGGPFLLLHIVADVLLVTYVVLLAQASQPSAARSGSVAPLGARTSLHDGLQSATVGRVTPSSARRIAN
jgi:hypothetical protein